MTITEFLNARLDEEEATTRAATPGPWAPEGKGVLDGDGIEFVEAPRRDVSHIARHSPARVLREIAAKRDLLALAGGALGDDTTVPDAEFMAGEIVKALAAVHSDHPDYRQEWKP